ncbi:MAG: sensor histidine kinase [Actinomycetota bacterium]
MRRRANAILVWLLWALTSVVLVALVWFQFQNASDVVVGVVFTVGQFAFATVGALVAWRRPSNPIGWIFLGVGLFSAGSSLAESYAVYAIFTEPQSLPKAEVAAWISAWSTGPSFGLLGLVLVLFPDGKTHSRRWRFLPYLILVGVVSLSLSGALTPGPLFGHFETVSNPFGVEGLKTLLTVVEGIGWGIWMFGTAAAALCVVLRYRGASREQREQLKWFMSAGALLALGFVGNGISWEGGDLQWLFTLSTGVMATGLIALPVSCAIAIFKYRLYSIDFIINKTILFALMAGFIGAVYVLVVVGIKALVFGTGSASTLPSLLATLVIAVAFQPVRERARRLANRLVYGSRSTPYDALASLAAGTAYATDADLERMAQVIGEGTGATRVAVWLRVESGSRLVASWPVSIGSADMGDFERVLPIVHQGEELGAIGLTKAPGDSLTSTEDHLLLGLVSQAGLVVRNLRLAAELEARLKEATRQAQEVRASRARIVAARDSERRRLERDIHDGAQQNLVALAVKIGLVRNLAGRDVDKAKTLLAEVSEEITRAIETLRNLSHGIYPPVLTRQGLLAALESEALGASLPVEIEATGLARLGPELEAAVYFCCLEALQNITKYAHARGVQIKLEQNDEALIFLVTDDGVGFDPSVAGTGSGLQNMRDRLKALGGDVVVASSPGEGTTIRGRIPLHVLVPSE